MEGNAVRAVGVCLTAGALFASQALMAAPLLGLRPSAGAMLSAAAFGRRSAPPPPGGRAPSASPPVLLPLEVMGSYSSALSAVVTVPPLAPGDHITGLTMTIHGLEYATQASVQVNGGAWTPLNNSTVAVAQPARSYGGIGGGFATVSMTLTLAAAAVNPGTAVVNFRFNGSNGVSTGFRVLAFNFVTSSGKTVLPASQFVQDNPASWRPPLTDSASIAQGKLLWRTAPLRGGASPTAASMQAHCMDCHAQDGRDLKYFNFSNKSIIQRSQFHGLTAQQGAQIASYIRSLNVPNPGRPWNPPYQPGPGLDSLPVSSWSAGAGLGAVLPHDLDMAATMFKFGMSPSAVATSGTLNLRELPIAIQLLDWNHWLPTIHPMDVWGAAFVNSSVNKRYNGEGTAVLASGSPMRPRLMAADSHDYILNSAKYDFYNWIVQDRAPFINPQTTPDAPWTPEYSRRMYSIAQWQAVKTWEMTQEFGLESYGPAIYGTTSEARSWFNTMMGSSSPQAIHISQDNRGLGGSALYQKYVSNSWDELQMIVNNGNRKNVGNGPIDWGYNYGNIVNLSQLSGVSEPMRFLTQLVKAMQDTDNGYGPDAPVYGWAPGSSGRVAMLAYDEPLWTGISPAARAAISQAVLQAWFDKTKQYTPAQYYAGGQADPQEIPVALTNTNFADATWAMIPRFRKQGVDGALLNSIADWAKTVWPLGSWDSLKQ
jgi:hypothetical protein